MNSLIKSLMVIVICIILTGCGGNIDWPDNKLTNQIPEPTFGQIETIDNFENILNITVKDIAQEEFERYVDECEKKGFDYVTKKSDNEMIAFNEDDYKLHLYFYEEVLKITVYQPIELDAVKWPENNTSKLLPTPKFNIGKVEWENLDGFLIYIGDFSKADFDDYIDLCKIKGFDVDPNKGEDYYYANNNSNYNISLFYQYDGKKVMTLKIEKGTRPSVEK